MVPPLTPPLIETTSNVASASVPSPSARTRSASIWTPRSDGTESNPQECTIGAPDAADVPGGQPLGHQPTDEPGRAEDHDVQITWCRLTRCRITRCRITRC